MQAERAAKNALEQNPFSKMDPAGGI